MQFLDKKSFHNHQNYWIALGLFLIGSMLLIALYMTFREQYFLYTSYGAFTIFLYRFIGGNYIAHYLQNTFEALKTILQNIIDFSSENRIALSIAFFFLFIGLLTWYIVVTQNYWIIFAIGVVVYIFYLIITNISEILSFLAKLLIGIIVLLSLMTISYFINSNTTETSTAKQDSQK